MKAINGFMCEKCGEIYTEEGVATKCESEHVNFKELKITDAFYNSRTDIIRDEKKKLKDNRFIPQTLRIRYKEKNKEGYFPQSFIAFYDLRKFEYREEDRAGD